jgi:hypothetical protein
MGEEPREYQHKGYIVRVRCYQRGTSEKPLGWVPEVELVRPEGSEVTIQSVSLPDQVYPTKEKAEQIALQLARQWIDEKG